MTWSRQRVQEENARKFVGVIEALAKDVRRVGMLIGEHLRVHRAMAERPGLVKQIEKLQKRAKRAEHQVYALATTLAATSHIRPTAGTPTERAQQPAPMETAPGVEPPVPTQNMTVCRVCGVLRDCERLLSGPICGPCMASAAARQMGEVELPVPKKSCEVCPDEDSCFQGRRDLLSKPVDAPCRRESEPAHSTAAPEKGKAKDPEPPVAHAAPVPEKSCGTCTGCPDPSANYASRGRLAEECRAAGYKMWRSDPAPRPAAPEVAPYPPFAIRSLDDLERAKNWAAAELQHVADCVGREPPTPEGEEPAPRDPFGPAPSGGQTVNTVAPGEPVAESQSEKLAPEEECPHLRLPYSVYNRSSERGICRITWAECRLCERGNIAPNPGRNWCSYRTLAADRTNLERECAEQRADRFGLLKRTQQAEAALAACRLKSSRRKRAIQDLQRNAMHWHGEYDSLYSFVEEGLNTGKVLAVGEHGSWAWLIPDATAYRDALADAEARAAGLGGKTP